MCDSKCANNIEDPTGRRAVIRAKPEAHRGAGRGEQILLGGAGREAQVCAPPNLVSVGHCLCLCLLLSCPCRGSSLHKMSAVRRRQGRAATARPEGRWRGRGGQEQGGGRGRVLRCAAGACPPDAQLGRAFGAAACPRIPLSRRQAAGGRQAGRHEAIGGGLPLLNHRRDSVTCAMDRGPRKMQRRR